MKKHLPKIFLLLIAAIILFLMFGCSPQPAVTEFNSAEDLAEARIGVMTGSTSEQLANKHFPAGNLSGMNAEIAYHIAITLNHPVEIHDMIFSALITAPQSGKIDLIVTGMSDTSERRQSVDFSEPYFANRQVLSVIRRLAREGMTMAIVTHEMEFARSVSIMLYQPPLKLSLDYEEIINRLKMSLESPGELFSPLEEHPGANEISRTLITGIAENFTVEKTAGKTGTTLSMEIKNKIS